MQTLIRLSLHLILLCTVLGPTLLLSQSQAPASDPQAIALAAQATTALTNGVAVNDITLFANATWTSGSEIETGSATLRAKGMDEGRVDLALSGGNRTEIRTVSNGFSLGASIGVDGVQKHAAPHNCWTSSSWFFPALTPLTFEPDPSVVLSYVGQEMQNGIVVYHLRASRWPQGGAAQAAPLFSPFSATDIYLDRRSLFPVSMTFNTHPDSDASANIAIEIRYSSYQAVSGITAPMHVQKFVSGTLELDLLVTGVTLNSGLPDSIFNAQ